MKPLKFTFATLFNNKNVIDHSKKQPWWLALIFILLTCLASTLPTFITSMNVQGSEIITAKENYSLDYSLKQFSLEYLSDENENNSYFEIKDGELHASNFDLAEIKHGDDITLLVKYVPFETGVDTAKYKNINNKIEAIKKELWTSYPVENVENKSHVYSTLFLGESVVQLHLFGAGKTSSFTKDESGEFTKIDLPDANKSFYGTYEGITGDLSILNSYYTGVDAAAKTKHAEESWKKFFDKAYEVPRNESAWLSLALYTGVTLFMILAMSLMIWLLSKTKVSPVKFKFIESLQMAIYASLCPALLSVLVSLLIPSLQSMGFMMFYVLRMTWLGMKATSPDQNNTNTVRK